MITSLVTVISIGLLLISLSTSVLATTTTWPISAFTDTNNNIAAWEDPDSNLMLLPHEWSIDLLEPIWFPDAPQSIAECEPSGSVQVMDLKDGRIMYKINLHVKGALMAVFDTNTGTMLVEGEMDYHFQTTIIVYNGEPDDPVPNLLQIWFPGFFLPPGAEPIGEGIFSHLTGKGAGTFLAADLALQYGFTVGEEVKVKVNEVGMLNKDFEDGHPNYYTDLGQFWPVEIVFLH